MTLSIHNRLGQCTYCPKLWDSTFISENGNVRKCCHAKDVILGNIYVNSLREIWEGPAYAKERERSLEGRLSCYANCSILDKPLITAAKSEPVSRYEELKTLHLQFGEACNIACIMCWQDSRKREELDFTHLTRNVELDHGMAFKLQGGEPLFISSLKRYFDFLAERGFKVSLMTNGLLINDEWAEKIVKHSEFLYVSLNAATQVTHEVVNRGSRWKVVLENIQRVRFERERQGSPLKLIGHMTIVPQNIEEVGEFITRFKEFGVDRINFGYDKSVPLLLADNAELCSRVTRQTSQAYENFAEKEWVETFRLRKLGILTSSEQFITSQRSAQPNQT